MLNPFIDSLIAVTLISLLSFVGLFFLVFKKEVLQKTLIFMVSFSVGGLFGDTFFHLLPEAMAENGFSFEVSLAILLGLLMFFILEKFIQWRHCHVPTSTTHPHPFVLMNLVGDGVHNLLDGMIIAASFLGSFSLGMATTLAVVFHEIPQKIGDFGVLVAGHLSPRKALLLNFLFSLTAVLGVLLVFFLNTDLVKIARFLIPFTAGGFIYIAGSDLIPELHKETSPTRSAIQLLGIMIGIGVMFLVKLWG